jgi:hypothetical protein
MKFERSRRGFAVRSMSSMRVTISRKISWSSMRARFAPRQ